ncbi:MAG: SDR family oxidoreductase [Novosphingobium sp.]
MNISGNTILITGGGSGIGRELARRWHELGNTVLITGRSAASLAETASGHAHIHPYVLDVSDPRAILDFAAKIVAEHPALNVLVNNAGIMPTEDLTRRRDLRDTEAVITTNLLGPIRMTDALIDHLRRQDDAAIINVTSGLAFVPLPRAATYSATKAALHSYTVSLRAVLEGEIEVIEIAPPAVRTELSPGQSAREDYMPLEEYIDETMAPFAAGTPGSEVLTQRVLFLRNAEIECRFDAALAALSSL